MWTVIYMAQTKESVLEVQSLLENDKIAVRIKPLCDGTSDGYYEILVPETETQQAHGVLIKNGY